MEAKQEYYQKGYVSFRARGGHVVFMLMVSVEDTHIKERKEVLESETMGISTKLMQKNIRNKIQ